MSKVNHVIVENFSNKSPNLSVLFVSVQGLKGVSECYFVGITSVAVISGVYWEYSHIVLYSYPQGICGLEVFMLITMFLQVDESQELNQVPSIQYLL